MASTDTRSLWLLPIVSMFWGAGQWKRFHAFVWGQWREVIKDKLPGGQNWDIWPLSFIRCVEIWKYSQWLQILNGENIKSHSKHSVRCCAQCLCLPEPRTWWMLKFVNFWTFSTCSQICWVFCLWTRGNGLHVGLALLPFLYATLQENRKSSRHLPFFFVLKIRISGSWPKWSDASHELPSISSHEAEHRKKFYWHFND